nr:immunoglobulin heavy chain junction region [Macaca mulatta]MOX39083.1 immunoglobulin heavy chain junction region [Macaca mulatta]MOX40500.1 immunoglobulin heavy chain junction region [Macaca mulatta]MOX40709.1 immunoglobulin heavy chain junction region [Macaca mulatta]MOX40845.1 immunoglobulin heavy chain junction region [Macaca mulatta]
CARHCRGIYCYTLGFDYW